MSLINFQNSQLLNRKSPNLTKLGFDYLQPIELEYFKIQKLLYTEYHIKCESMLTMMEHFSIPSSKTMHTLFNLFDIEARSLSKANITALSQNRSVINDGFIWNSKQNWHTTWNNKQVYLRSSYEENFATELDNQRIDYETECLRILYFDTIQQKYRIAIPDFYLPDTNTIVEIKAMYWLDLPNMEDKSKEYKKLGFNFKLIVDGITFGGTGEVRTHGLTP